MSVSRYARYFDKAVELGGRRITVNVDGRRHNVKAVIQNSGRNFMRKYDDDHTKRGIIGRARRRDKVVFMPYFAAFEYATRDVIVTVGGKDYVVIADSVVYFGDRPLYIWALISETAEAFGGYFDDLDELGS